ncbi:hypothetical protein Ancab_034412 [Ancistrocladus abbreviatus]
MDRFLDSLSRLDQELTSGKPLLLGVILYPWDGFAILRLFGSNGFMLTMCSPLISQLLAGFVKLLLKRRSSVKEKLMHQDPEGGSEQVLPSKFRFVMRKDEAVPRPKFLSGH